MLRLGRVAMAYATLVAVFTALHYYAAVAGEIDLGAGSKAETVWAAFAHTAAHATLGASTAAPRGAIAVLLASALRVGALAVLVAAVVAAGVSERTAAAGVPST